MRLLPHASLTHRRLFVLPLLALAVAAASGCNLQFSTGVEARSGWTRTYKVKPDATVEIRETNGRIRVEAVDADQVDVVATRIAKASTEETAKAAAEKIEIKEQATADRVEIDSVVEGLQIAFGQSQRVDYDVKMPRGGRLIIKTTNGEVRVHAITGHVKIDAVNGDISADGLEQGADVTAVNGRVQLEFAKIGESGVRTKTTNGQIIVTLPVGAKATLAARVLNGAISTSNLTMQASEDSRRRLDATIGGGGPEVRLDTTNGEIRIVGK